MWGEEQAFHLFDNTASNYLYGRQAMTSAQAWQDHGCYKLNSTQYLNFGEILDRGIPPGRSATGYDLTPKLQYVYDARWEQRPVSGPLDLGAFEYTGSAAGTKGTSAKSHS